MSDTVTGTLTDFLLARIAEDEAGAQMMHARGAPVVQWLGFLPGRGSLADHMSTECESKRRIVEWVTRAQRYATEGQPGAFDPEDARALTHALRLLALPYADHPDFRGEWRPRG